MLRYPQSRRRHGTWAAMGTPGLLRRGRTPELRVGRPRAGRLAQRRNTGGAGAGAPAGRATADAQQDQRDADAAGRALCRVGARHAAPGRKRARSAARDAARRPGPAALSAPDLLGVALLPAVLRRYAEDYPDVRIDISYTDKWVDPIAEGLDFAVRGGFPASSELLGARLWPYERLLCASPDYVARMGLPREPEDLVRHRLIMHTPARAQGLAPARRGQHPAPARGAGPPRQHWQQPDGAGAGRRGRGAAGGLGRAAGNRTRHAGARVSGLYRDLGPGRVAPGPRRVRIALLAGPRRAMLAALRQAGAGLMDAPAPPATPPARHAS